MKSTYIIGLDFGTSGIRSILFDTAGNQISTGFVETPTTYPKPGYAQIDPNLVASR